MVKTRPQPSATISLRMYVVIAVRKDPVTWDTDFSELKPFRIPERLFVCIM